MEAKQINFGELKSICKYHNYIKLRLYDNTLIGFNCRNVKLSRFKNIEDSRITKYISFIPCNFSEYIRTKTPFIKS